MTAPVAGPMMYFIMVVRRNAREHAERRHYPHRYAHGERRLLNVLELERELAEEHGLADLDEGRERQHAGHDADDGDEGVADAACLRGLFKGGLIDEPLGVEAVEGRDAADGERADEEERRGLGHLPRQAAELFEVGWCPWRRARAPAVRNSRPLKSVWFMAW